MELHQSEIYASVKFQALLINYSTVTVGLRITGNHIFNKPKARELELRWQPQNTIRLCTNQIDHDLSLLRYVSVPNLLVRNVDCMHMLNHLHPEDDIMTCRPFQGLTSPRSESSILLHAYRQVTMAYCIWQRHATISWKPLLSSTDFLCSECAGRFSSLTVTSMMICCKSVLF